MLSYGSISNSDIQSYVWELLGGLVEKSPALKRIVIDDAFSERLSAPPPTEVGGCYLGQLEIGVTLFHLFCAVIWEAYG
jgi:hypothetical protein